MIIVHREDILRKGTFCDSPELRQIEEDIATGISKISWPDTSGGFYLDPNSRGKGRGEGNGVKPIKEAFIWYLTHAEWLDERIVRSSDVAGTGPLDAVKETSQGLFAVEWETGNISSSHRAMNKICLGVLRNELIGGTLVLPSEQLYPFLTDRIGNFRELVPYIPFWKSPPYKKGVISIVVVEQDGLREGTPRIPKGTDGRALI